MAIADLVAAIEAEARAQISAVLAAGEAEASAIEAEAERARRDHRASTLQVWQAEHQRAADAQLVAAERRARALVLAARAAMLERIRLEVHALLPSLVDHTLGRALVTAALSCASGPGVLRCAPHLANLIVAPEELRVEPDPAVATGVQIELASGARVVATLEALCEREWPRLAAFALTLVDEESPP